MPAPPAGRAPSRAHGRSPVLRRPAGRLLIAVLLVAATVGWRRGTYFSGALDPVVLAKAAVSVLALVLALLAAAAGPRARVGTGTLWVLALLLGGSVFGALTAGGVLAGGMVAARVVVVALAVFLLLRSADVREVVLALARACGLVAAVAAVTGL